MIIVKVNKSKNNAYKSIKDSMSKKEEISVRNSLDACGCTGNGCC